MGIEKLLRDDMLKAIQLHYEKKDYTESVRDAMFFVSELVREKSGLDDKDGVSLFEAAFLGKNAALKINDGNSETERNIQEGLGFVLKGMSQMIRNPISHGKVIMSESEAISIILFCNELIKKIDNSNGKTLIDNYLDIISLPDFTPSKEYAELLAIRIPEKKRFELLISIFEQREKLKNAPLMNLIKYLIEGITPNERKKLIETIDDGLLLCKSNYELAGFINLFYLHVKDDMAVICRLRIQDLILKSVTNGNFEYYSNYPNQIDEMTNEEGTLAECVADNILLFQNKDDIIKAMYKKLIAGGNEEKYVISTFSQVVFRLEIPVPSKLERKIRLSLDNSSMEYDERYMNALEKVMNESGDNQWKRMFGDIYNYQFDYDFDLPPLFIQE